MIAETVLIAVNEQKADLIESYMDDAYSDGHNYKSWIDEQSRSWKDRESNEIYIEGATYDIGNVYKADGHTCVKVTIHFTSEGMFGGSSLFGSNYERSFYCHMNRTPDGDKWSIGGKNNPIQIQDDSSGLY